MVENMILSMAQRGQITNKLGEPELINILESINKQASANTPKVKVINIINDCLNFFVNYRSLIIFIIIVLSANIYYQAIIIL